MRKSNILTIVLLLATTLSNYAAGFADETLNYVVSYKWGLVHKDAGEATLKLRNNGSNYEMTLVGRTKPWADKFYQVRDTLICTMQKQNLRPLKYIKIAHEDGKYGKDEITYSYGGSAVGGHSVKTRINKKGEKKVTEKNFTASGPTYDMLSVFYFLRTIDYNNLISGKPIKATLFSGSKVETLTVRCVGKENLKLRNNTKREAYHIKFKFTQAGQKKSSDDLDAWISTDAQHIPLQIVGSLPMGQVRCYYVPN